MPRFIKNWKENGRPFSGQVLRRKLEKKGVPPSIIESRVNERVEKLDKAKAIGESALDIGASILPMGATAGAVMNAVPVLKDIPVVKEYAQQAVDTLKNSSQHPIVAVIKDVLPLTELVMRKRWKEAAAGLIALLTPVAVYLLA